jgi:hypothetical protein
MNKTFKAVAFHAWLVFKYLPLVIFPFLKSKRDLVEVDKDRDTMHRLAREADHSG